MRVDESLNVATITVDFSDEDSVFHAVMFILSNSAAGNANDPNSDGSNILTTKVRFIKTLMDYAKHLRDHNSSGFKSRPKGSLGDAKGFLESKFCFVVNGANKREGGQW